jgi:pimeloyl-ACP methyl ester carboxylesterase
VYADDVAKLMHDLGIARAVFVGTSMGGLITMTLAVRSTST